MRAKKKNTVFYTWKFWREQISCVLNTHAHKVVINVRWQMCLLDCANHFIMHMYITHQVVHLKYILFFFFLFGCTCGKWKFPGQGSNPSHNCDLCHSCGNIGSLTCCATAGTLYFLFVNYISIKLEEKRVSAWSKIWWKKINPKFMFTGFILWGEKS